MYAWVEFDLIQVVNGQVSFCILYTVSNWTMGRPGNEARSYQRAFFWLGLGQL